MDIQKTQSLYRTEQDLLYDPNYYKYIFKKTEKLACAVFYIVDQSVGEKDSIVVSAVAEAAKRALDMALASLSFPPHAAAREVHLLAQSLVSLQSHIRLAHAVGMMATDAMDLLVFDAESVLRALRQYQAAERTRLSAVAEEAAGSPTRSLQRPLRAQATADRQEPTDRQSKRQGNERQRLIKDILSSQGQATIKDIAAHIKDCSEKTIQRELNLLISEGTVRKEGERRWSRYSLAQHVS